MKYNKRIYLFFLISAMCFVVRAQDYTMIPVNLNAQSFPGNFFLSKAKVQNNSANTIHIFMERIVKNIPNNWTSCFCAPFCIAPFVDTLSFNIAPYSNDSIMPNYGTDSIPGFGTIVSKVYQTGYESSPNTITFTGSTLSSGINVVPFASVFTVCPNPFCSSINLKSKDARSFNASVYNLAGEIVFRKENLDSGEENIDLNFLSPGIYFLKAKLSDSEVAIKKIIKN